MKYLSVCSGIEAASVAWHGLGFEPVGFSEIESFSSAVLAHRFPHVKNYGDMSKFKEWEINEQIELIVGGTPCQSFSVAGLRKGLDDPRGNLMLTFGAIANHFKPRFILWENVPGVLSTNGGRDFASFIDMLSELGYICDIDILDAQYFGVPQRRRRVFVCGQHRDYLLKEKTDTSALIIIQLLQEISQTILKEELFKSGKERQSSDCLDRLKDGLMKRMRLFGLDGENDNYNLLQQNLVEAFRRHRQELKNLNATHGEYQAKDTPAEKLKGLDVDSRYMNIERLLKEVLDESCVVMRSYTTSTQTKTTTQSKIFLFSRLALITAGLIPHLSQSSPSFWSAASSSLTTLKEYMNYARQTNRSLFEKESNICMWNDFIREADELCSIIGGFRAECFGKVSTITESLRWDIAPSRKARKDIAGTLSSRTTGGGGLGTDFELSGGLQIAYGIAGNIIGRKPENGGNGCGYQYELSYTLTKTDECGVIQGSTVRRLTPVECERLQGFPDNWTRIPWRGKPEADCPDGPRYKACGNSMAVPVMRWIGERILETA